MSFVIGGMLFTEENNLMNVQTLFPSLFHGLQDVRLYFITAEGTRL